jgi:cystathionine beta-lyase/cystathionine gamma-synthase
LDILRNEPRATEVRGNPDNYLHEAALAETHPVALLVEIISNPLLKVADLPALAPLELATFRLIQDERSIPRLRR